MKQPIYSTVRAVGAGIMWGGLVAGLVGGLMVLVGADATFGVILILGVICYFTGGRLERRAQRQAQVETKAAGGAAPEQAGEWLSCAPHADMEAVDTLSAILWLYRRLPRAYERQPHIDAVVERLARQTGTDVAGELAERGAAEGSSHG